MSTTNTETLNWQDIISGWTFSCGDEAPPEGLAESVVPAVSKSTDGLFEITTITFGFSGTAPYHQQKFTAEFSFSVSEAANFYEIAVSSDDTATVRRNGNDFVSSQLNRNGIASSAWSDTAATLPEVSGTFETVGGPYSLSVTITLKRLVGAEWTVSEEWTESGPYEIKTATLSFSGNARSNTQGFSWNSPEINIDGGNWIEINVEADDETTITAGTYSKKATLYSPVEFNSGWLKEAPATFPLSVSYRNAGGPYRLSVTVTVKRSLREVYFSAQNNTPQELEQANTNFNDENEKKAWLNEQRLCRTAFGVGEFVELGVRNFQTEEDIITQSSAILGDVVTATSGKTILNTRHLENTTIAGELYFPDGEILTFEADLKCPEYEISREITEEEFKKLTEGKQELINYGGLPYFDGHYFAVQVCPTDVSFSGLYHWEDNYPEEKTGLFNELPPNDVVHKPAVPYALNDYNACADKAYYAVYFQEEKIINASVDNDGHVGTLIWQCPVRWSFDAQTGDVKNSERLSDGTLPARIQKTILDRNPNDTSLVVTITKEFSPE